MEDAELGRQVSELAISYSIKEILSRIEENQHRLDEKVIALKDTLATKAEVEALATIVNRHETRWQRIFGAAMALGALTGGATGWLVNVLQGGN